MFVTPTLCGGAVDTAFRADESYVSGSLSTLAARVVASQFWYRPAGQCRWVTRARYTS
jgi:hypothetical protein